MTLDLTREDLMIALDPKLTKQQKNFRIHQMQEARKSVSAKIRRC